MYFFFQGLKEQNGLFFRILILFCFFFLSKWRTPCCASLIIMPCNIYDAITFKHVISNKKKNLHMYIVWVMTYWLPSDIYLVIYVKVQVLYRLMCIQCLKENKKESGSTQPKLYCVGVRCKHNKGEESPCNSVTSPHPSLPLHQLVLLVYSIPYWSRFLEIRICIDYPVDQGWRNLYIRKVLSSCVNFVYCNGSRSKQRILPLPGRREHCLCYCSSQKSTYTFRVNEIRLGAAVDPIF